VTCTDHLDEAPTLVESEPVEVEREMAADDHSSVETAEADQEPAAPVFEQ
jgi:hypothetical protein